MSPNKDDISWIFFYFVTYLLAKGKILSFIFRNGLISSFLLSKGSSSNMTCLLSFSLSSRDLFIHFFWGLIGLLSSLSSSWWHFSRAFLTIYWILEWSSVLSCKDNNLLDSEFSSSSSWWPVWLSSAFAVTLPSRY